MKVLGYDHVNGWSPLADLGTKDPILFRSKVNLDFTSRTFHVQFDVVLDFEKCIRLAKLFQNLIGDLIDNDNIGLHLDALRQTLGGLWVKRAYTKGKKGKMDKER
jgi:hypothetical protein